MLEQLFSLIQNHSQEAIVNNPAIPNEHNESAMQTILGSIMGGAAQNQGGLMDLISGGGASSNIMGNPMVSGIAQQATGALMEKFGITNGVAQGIISQVLPNVLNSLISKTNDPNDSSFTQEGIMGALSDGKLDMSDIFRVAGGLFGKK